MWPPISLFQREREREREDTHAVVARKEEFQAAVVKKEAEKGGFPCVSTLGLASFFFFKH